MGLISSETVSAAQCDLSYGLAKEPHPRQEAAADRRRRPRLARRVHPHLRAARALVAETLKLEHALSDLVNQAYGLTPAEIAPMWKTAPPRMPMSEQL